MAMSEQYVAAIDQGTTSSRCIVFDRAARIVVGRPEGAPQIFPRPGWVEHDADEIWRNVAGGRARRARQRRSCGRSDLVGARHHQPARDDACCGTARPASRCTTRSSGRTRAPTSSCASWAATPARTASATAAGCRWPPTSPGPKLRWLLDTRAGPARARRGRRGAVRDDGLLADLEPHRPPRHRRHQRQPDHADEPRHARLGRRAARRDRRAAGDAARDPARRRRSTARRGGALAGRAGRRRARRPAGGAVRADLLRARRGQVHLRHRQLPAPQHRRAAGAVGQRAAHHRRLPASATSPPTYALEGSIAVTGALVQWFRDNLGADRHGARDRDAGAHRRGQRRLLLRARLLRACSRRTGAATRAA